MRFRQLIRGIGMRSIFIALLLISGMPVHASLIDNGSYTTDDLSGLDWLDLTESNNMTMQGALASNTGWRYATNSEVEGLFWQLFPGYYDTNLTSHYSATNSGNAYSNQNNDVTVFFALFGSSVVNDSRDMSGLYRDEDGLIKVMGVQSQISTGDSWVQGLEFWPSQPNYETTSTAIGFGTYLVRTSVVPVPAAIWLFGSALAGLGWLRRK